MRESLAMCDKHCYYIAVGIGNGFKSKRPLARTPPCGPLVAFQPIVNIAKICVDQKHAVIFSLNLACLALVIDP